MVSPKQSSKRISSLLLSVGAVILAGVTACGQSSGPAPGEIELNSRFDADFDLVDHHGNPATDERFEGKAMLIYYGFSNCPDVCPAALGNLTATLDRMGSKADKLQPLFITVDPKRDDPERLKNHLAYDERILGLTGSPEAAEAARKAMNVYAAEVPLPDSAMEYTVDHQSLFYLTDEQGVPLVAFPDTLPPEEIESLVKRYVG